MSTTPGFQTIGHVTGAARGILQLEGGAVLAAAAAAFGQLDGSWGLFAGLFLVPDLSMLGYLAGPRIGAACYNAGHSYLGPLLLAAAGAARGETLLLQLAAIWVAHVGFDRMLGYGLKSGAGFGFTHLGRKGKAARQTAEV
jgi:hypothetical protein